MPSIFEISASALTAERIRMQTIANNLANIETGRAGVDAQGNAVPYRRKRVHFEVGIPGQSRTEGVSVARIEEDPAPFRLVHDPSNPLAVKSGPEAGYVRMPNVNPTMEMVDLIAASRAYEANITAMEAARSMATSAIRILA